MKKSNFLAVCFLASCLATSAIAEQTVKLTTSKTVGEKMRLMVNPKGTMSVNWGDGTFIEYPGTTESFRFLEGEVKGDTIVIKGSDLEWNMLGCAGQNIVTLNVSAAPGLRSLYCQNNEIKNLALSKVKNLTDLNAANNLISTVAVKPSTHAKMENIDLSGNTIKNNGSGTNFTFNTGNIQLININNNKFTSVTITDATMLDALYCAGNSIKNLSFKNSPNITTICCEDNDITKFTALDSLKSLQTFIANDNKIGNTLDFSNSADLNTVNVANNKIKSVILPNKKLTAYDCSNNSLTFGSLPKTVPPYVNYSPQATIVVTEGMKKTANGVPYMDVCPSYADRNKTEYILDLSDYREGPGHTATGSSITVYAIEDDGTERELTKASASKPNNEYTFSNGKITFLQPQKRVIIKVTKSNYKDLVLVSDEFCVGEDIATDINDVTTAANNLEVLTQKGYVTLNANVRTLVNIIDMSGKKVWGGVVVGTTTINLPTGVYIINGKKYSI